MNNIFALSSKFYVFAFLILLWIVPFCAFSQKNLCFNDFENNEYKLKKNAIKVFVFLDTECPISQQYLPNLEALREEFSHNSIQFLAIFPTKGVTNQEVITLQKKYNFHYPFIIDSNKKLTISLDAKTTPEVFILNDKNNILYRGAIDDLYYDLGRKRHNASIFYLENAIKSIIEHQPITIETTQAIGCDIER